jgi:peptidoglycan-N-acetylglucosamine deacetylase
VAPHSGQCQEDIGDIVLTFDDGPNPNTTPKLLDFFGENNIKVIFFVIGKRIITEHGLSVLRRAHLEGHIIGNHTFSHHNLVKLTKHKIRDEILRNHELICKYTGTCDLFRPPYGSTNRIVKQVLKELGYTQIFWNVDTMDWKYRIDCYWIDYGMKQLLPRINNIILMHDIYHTTVDNINNFIARIKLNFNTRFSLITPTANNSDRDVYTISS